MPNYGSMSIRELVQFGTDRQDRPEPKAPAPRLPEPRVPAGRRDGGEWTRSFPPGLLFPAQEILPWPNPWLDFFSDSDKIIPPQYKTPIPRLSGAEGAKNAPSWARGSRPFKGENGRNFAKRLLDEKYGPGNWSEKEPEYGQIKKWGDRAFRSDLISPDQDYSL